MKMECLKYFYNALMDNLSLLIRSISMHAFTFTPFPPLYNTYTGCFGFVKEGGRGRESVCVRACLSYEKV